MGKSIVNSGPWAAAGVNSIALLRSGWFCAAEGWLEQHRKDYEVYQEIAYARNIESLIRSGWIEAENARLSIENAGLVQKAMARLPLSGSGEASRYVDEIYRQDHKKWLSSLGF